MKAESVFLGGILLAAALVQPVLPDGTIIPGEGVQGLVRLGPYTAAVRQLKEASGRPGDPIPTFRRLQGDRQIIDFLPFGVRLIVDRKGKVEIVVVIASGTTIRGKSVRLLTVKGVGIGSLEKKVVQAYGVKPVETSTVPDGYVHYYSCIGFDISNDTHAVRAVLVYSARHPVRGCGNEK